MIVSNSEAECVCNSGTILWNSGKGGKEKNDRASVIP
jgi:hypothetical protein